ncbi:MAG: DUF342 domain-containing protein [Clostridia bacterium]|nr:DUF342 domain-containing protein [Clostridia bacterium]
MSDIQVRISDDYYKAYLSLRFKDEPITLSEVLKAIEERHITYGLDLDVIKALVEMKEDVYDEIIAEGQPHINGIDSEITHFFKESMAAKPAISSDGKVDFKNLNLLQKVTEGTLLAEKTPLTEGIDGMTVTGKVIHAKNGRDYNISVGENVIFGEKGLKVYAGCDGVFQMENEKISVKKLLEFKNGVGVDTGNVEFNGDIVVSGKVTDGYSIKCEGNLTINDMVEGAFLEVGGDLVVTKGISGHNQSVIHCDGNMIVKYIDNCEVYVKGNLEAGEILNCKVMCNGEVTVKGKKGHIIGGEITAKYAINATTIGSRLGVITLINLGVDIDSIQELRTLQEEIKVEKETEKKVLQFIQILTEKKRKNIITDEETQLLDRCFETRDQAKYNIKEKTGQLEALREMILKAQQGEIKTETIYPDTLVKIGHASYFIDEALLRSIIKKSNDEIVAIGF